jgi:hypothetical protein
MGGDPAARKRLIGVITLDSGTGQADHIAILFGANPGAWVPSSREHPKNIEN